MKSPPIPRVLTVVAVAAGVVLAVASPASAAVAGFNLRGPGGKCADVSGPDTGGNGAAVQIWDCQSGSVDQRWARQGSTFRSLGRCLDIQGNATGAGSKVQLWDCNGSGGQNWQPRFDGSLLNPQSGRCLDSPGSSTTNGTQLQIWDCNGTGAQKYAMSGVGSGGFVYPAPGQRTGPGVLPPAAASTSYPGKQDFGHNIVRDLGFSGVVSGQSIWTYGDTLVALDNGGYGFAASDSVAIGDLADPGRIYDTNVSAEGWPREWIPYTAAEEANGGGGRYGMGGTNVIEYSPGKGLVWFLKNDRGSNGQGLVGAGVATVTADANGAHATRVQDTLWGSTEPHWGDVGVTFNPQDGKAYVYGYGPAPFDTDVFLTRVDASRATDVSAYEYWDNSTKSWTIRRFSLGGEFGTVKLSDSLAVFTGRDLGQSNAFWSNYYNTWMFVAGANVGYTDIMVSTAPRLEGPWTKPFTVASTCPNNSCSGLRYAIAPHPEYDPSGKTLLVTWTDSNAIQQAKITWR